MYTAQSINELLRESVMMMRMMMTTMIIAAIILWSTNLVITPTERSFCEFITTALKALGRFQYFSDSLI